MPDLTTIPYINMIPDDFDPTIIKTIPIIGDIYGAGNTVIDFYESNCRPTWDVYIKLLFPALGTAVITYLDFGLSDILRGYFRPTGTRGFGFLNRGKRSRLKKPTTKLGKFGRYLKIPEIGNMFGKVLPGAKFFRGVQVGNKANWFWSISDVIARGGWYWLVADITEEFTIAWTTALYHSDACAHPESGYCRFHVHDDYFAPDTWQLLAFPHQEGECSVFHDGGYFPIPIERGNPTIFASAEGKWWVQPGVTGFSLKIADINDPTHIYSTSPLVPIEGEGTGTNYIFAKLAGPGYYGVFIKPHGGFLHVTSGYLTLEVTYS